MSAVTGVGILANLDPTFQPPTPPTTIDFFGTISFIVANFVIFFTLMGVSTTFFIVGAVLITTITITMLWVVLRLVRGGG